MKTMKNILFIILLIALLFIFGCNVNKVDKIAKNKVVSDHNIKEQAQESPVKGSVSTTITQNNTEVKTNKVLFIIAPKDFRDEELFNTKQVIEDNGYKVIIASKNVDIATGMLGAKVKVDKDISKIDINDYLGLVLIGGSGTSIYFDDKEVLDIVRAAYDKGKVIGAICLGPGVLANAGILKGKRATSYRSAHKMLSDHGAIVIDEPVVVDDNIITANGPTAAYDFGTAIVRALKGSEQ